MPFKQAEVGAHKLKWLTRISKKLELVYKKIGKNAKFNDFRGGQV